MIEEITVDSSVIIASLLEQEREHIKASQLWEEVISGNLNAIMPCTVLIEVVAAIKRRTGMEELALRVKNELLSLDTVNFVIIDTDAAIKASNIAAEVGVRGMDAIVIQTAMEYNTALVSLDIEMIKKASLIVKTRGL